MTMRAGVPHPRSPAWCVRVGLLVVLALAGLVVTAGPAGAHATLLGSDPAEGEVLAEAPEQASFAFDEPVRLQAGSVHVFAADGDELTAKATTSDRRLVVDLPSSMPHGSYVVAWRVISTDGHPVAGALTFSVGSPSARIATPELAGDTTPASVEIGLAAVAALVYAAAFLAVGLTVFALLLLPRGRGLDDVRTRIRRVAAAAGGTAILAAIVQLPVNAAYQRGDGIGAAFNPSTWKVDASAPEPWAALLLVVGIATTVGAGRLTLPAVARRPAEEWLALAGGALGLGSLALVGHTRSFGPRALTVLADIAHVLAGAVWLGGLVGLVIALPRLATRPRVGALALARFSTLAAFLLAAVAAAGGILAWRILGSWSAFLDTSFGVTLLVKIALVALVAGLAGINRWRLLPAVTASAAGHQGRERAGRRLRRAVGVEAVLLVAVLGVTGVLVDRSPVPDATGPVAAPAGLDDHTFVGRAPGLRVVVRLDPLTIGANDVLVQIQDQAEDPIEPYAAPTVSFSLDALDLGSQPVANVDSGTYRGHVVLPRAGAWSVDVTVRTGEFASRVVRVPVSVR